MTSARALHTDTRGQFSVERISLAPESQPDRGSPMGLMQLIRDNRLWATIGRVLALLGTITGLILGTSKVIHLFRGPSLVGVIETRDYRVDPKTQELFEKAISGEYLSSLISRMRGKRETSGKILEAVENELKEDRVKGLAFGYLNILRPGTELRITVQNNGSEVAQDVRVILPGKGKAQVHVRGIIDLTTELIDWSRSIPLGDIPPKGVVLVNAWLDGMNLFELVPIRSALVHSKGGGTLREAYLFHGWGADIVHWYLELGSTLQVGSIVLVCAFFGLPIWFAMRRGYVVVNLRRMDTRPDENASLKADGRS